jgi:lysophospholipase L1-like esterase
MVRTFASIAAFGVAVLLSHGPVLAQVAAARGSVASSTKSASDPTPYPADAKNWPGQGAIRVYGYMNNYRQSFWRERERKQGSVVFAGDSLVGRWRTLAEDLPGVPVANRGMDAEVSRGLLFRFKEDVLDLHPEAIVLLIGTNDVGAQQDIRQTRSNLVEMLDMAEREMPRVPIVLCTLPPRGDMTSPSDLSRLNDANMLIASMAQGRSHVAVLDLHALLSDPDGSPHAAYFVDDKLHMTTAGYQRFRDALLPVLNQFKRG